MFRKRMASMLVHLKRCIVCPTRSIPWLPVKDFQLSRAYGDRARTLRASLFGEEGFKREAHV